jgi:hypothetical protein
MDDRVTVVVNERIRIDTYFDRYDFVFEYQNEFYRCQYSIGRLGNSDGPVWNMNGEYVSAWRVVPVKVTSTKYV